MQRREFTTALFAAPAAPPRIRAAMIGNDHGHAASKRKALSSMAEYDFIGVVEPDAAFNDKSLEMIAIETRDYQRNLELAQLAIASGKHVHLDKPPGTSYEGLRDMFIIAREKKLAVQMGYQWRYHPGMNAVLDAARNGKLGRVYRFRASIDKPAREMSPYKGGMMFIEGCHLVDRATALLGKPRKVTGFIPGDDNNLVVLEYDGVIAEISVANGDPNGNAHRYVEVIGTKGTAKASPFAPARVHFHMEGEQPRSYDPPPFPTYTPDFAELAATIRTGKKPSYSFDHDLMTHRVLLEACGML